MDFLSNDIKYLKLLSSQYNNKHKVLERLIELKALQNSPKKTELFLSDMHGEFSALKHIIRTSSGIIREKANMLFFSKLLEQDIVDTCMFIYYPEEKYDYICSLSDTKTYDDNYFYNIIDRMITIARAFFSEYTLEELDSFADFSYKNIIFELLSISENDKTTIKKEYYTKAIESVQNSHATREFIISLANFILSLSVKEYHIVGDIYDRGADADKVVELLKTLENIDIEWGNHDILWMGAACLSEILIALAVKNSIRYKSLDMLEKGYGISLRELERFSNETYKEGELYDKMHKAITIIAFKLEGKLIERNPDYDMQDRLLLHTIDKEKGTVKLKGVEYKLNTVDFPTIDKNHPYDLTDTEKKVLSELKESFASSKVLQDHIKFIYEKGSLYKITNYNLLYHALIPVDENGNFLKFKIDNEYYSGRQLYDKLDVVIRRAYFEKDYKNHSSDLDLMYYLWAGPLSVLSGKDKIATFERMFIEDETTHKEHKNAYYTLREDENFCHKIIDEFNLIKEKTKIINGHVPVKTMKGESPIKGSSILLDIDGGICKAYHNATGIAGLSLIYDSFGYKLVTHLPFSSKEDVIAQNIDKRAKKETLTTSDRMLIKDTDAGENIQEQIYNLTSLLQCYEEGIIEESL